MGILHLQQTNLVVQMCQGCQQPGHKYQYRVCIMSELVEIEYELVHTIGKHPPGVLL